MLECIRPRHQSASRRGPGGLNDVFSSADEAVVTVAHGLHVEQLPVANMTVGQIRARYADRFDIDARTPATINGQDADDDVTVRTGQLLSFVRNAGEKGL